MKKSKKKNSESGEDEVDNMVGFRGKQKFNHDENNTTEDFVDFGRTTTQNDLSEDIKDDQAPKIMLRNMVGKRDETATLIIDEKDNAEDDINDSQPYPFTILDFLVAIVSIVVFVADIITDILLALEYKDHGRTAECALTSSVVVASFLVAGILSTIWYVQDGNGPKGGIQRTLFLIVAFPFATIIRKISYIKYGCLSRKSTDKHTHYKRMIKDRSDASLLCMFDAFVESAPQLIIQIYLTIRTTPQEALHLEILRSISIASSLASLAWSVTAYNRALRVLNATSGLAAITTCGTVGYFLWRVFEIGPRITAIVMLISVKGNGPYYIIFGVLFHWMVMIAVAFFKNVKVYKNKKLHNILFIVFIGFVQILSFMNLSEDKSRVLAITYYSLFHIENAVMVALFVFWGDVDKSSLAYITTISVASSGIILCTLFMLMYYTLCHPKVSRSWRNCNNDEELNEQS